MAILFAIGNLLRAIDYLGILMQSQHNQTEKKIFIFILFFLFWEPEHQTYKDVSFNSKKKPHFLAKTINNFHLIS